jgi:hypothetical protein
MILACIQTDHSGLIERVPVSANNIYSPHLNLGGVMADTTTIFNFNQYKSKGG